MGWIWGLARRAGKVLAWSTAGAMVLLGMNRPVVSDEKAVEGVRRMLVEIEAGREMARPDHVQAELEAVAERVAGEMGFPTDHQRMTREQQRVLFARLDGEVRKRDPELWRLKQVSDLCSGIWAQTFGMDYVMVIQPVLWMREMGRVGGPVLAAVLVLARRRKRRRARG